MQPALTGLVRDSKAGIETLQLTIRSQDKPKSEKDKKRKLDDNLNKIEKVCPLASQATMSHCCHTAAPVLALLSSEPMRCVCCQVIESRQEARTKGEAVDMPKQPRLK
jgi:hypothetical protein